MTCIPLPPPPLPGYILQLLLVKFFLHLKVKLFVNEQFRVPLSQHKYYSSNDLNNN